ncbi:hypothetical protein HPB52_001938 [Rhipicephalus sanguineus]|uniref:Sphingomyelin phosphodiesterase D n=1 Tax=Rhipicephalus sanguineus TaxID=34632 RepID=A0A9D4SVG1_RHISA|nr:hypothetical protein HPB52_001938 [Rhipicephalus sanguineus]
MAPASRSRIIAAALLFFVAKRSMAGPASSNRLEELERPFFNIAHMVNSIKEVDQYLRLGANAIEADVTFQADGTAKQTFHGSPCDCFRNCYMRENIVDYLEYIRKVTGPPDAKYKNRVALLFLDLKVSDLPAPSKLKAGKDISKKLLEHLWYNVDPNNTVNVLLSIGHVSDKDVFKGVVETLMKNGDPIIAERVGFDVGLNDPLEDISKMYGELGIDHNRWQGDGVSNCISLFRPTNRLKQALRYRDSRSDRSYADKVYHWTIDLSSAIRNSLRLGVDGIITNYPERVSTVLMEAPFKRAVKLASPQDTPWKKASIELLMPGGGGSPISTVLGDVSEVLQQFWAYVVTRLSGHIFRRRSSRDYDAIEADPPMSPRELQEQRYYRWLHKKLLA